MQNSALTALKQKYPEGSPKVAKLSDEAKAWLVIKIQAITKEESQAYSMVLKNMRKRLLHATEDIPDNQLQKMVDFIFENIEEIEKSI
ncbi:MAG: hypothetical protein ACTTKH_05045 [Treponema sp.]